MGPDYKPPDRWPRYAYARYYSSGYGLAAVPVINCTSIRIDGGTHYPYHALEWTKAAARPVAAVRSCPVLQDPVQPWWPPRINRNSRACGLKPPPGRWPRFAHVRSHRIWYSHGGPPDSTATPAARRSG